MSTDMSHFIGELDAGVFSDKLGAVLTDCVARTVEHGKKSQLTISLDISKLGSGSQINVKHKYKFTAPTKNGSQSEENTTETAMNQNEDGSVTLFPKNQGQLFGHPQKDHA